MKRDKINAPRQPYWPTVFIIIFIFLTDWPTDGKTDRQAGWLAGGQTEFIIIFIFLIKKNENKG